MCSQMKYLYSLLMIALSSGCAYSIADIDVSKSEPSCVRQCSTAYSSCVSGGNQVGFKTETLRACQESYKVCVQTCPAK
jgi:hypothetical protein